MVAKKPTLPTPLAERLHVSLGSVKINNQSVRRCPKPGLSNSKSEIPIKGSPPTTMLCGDRRLPSRISGLPHSWSPSSKWVSGMIRNWLLMASLGVLAYSLDVRPTS